MCLTDMLTFEIEKRNMTFAEKTVVVTGAAGNLGKAVAKAFLDQKARVVLVDRDRTTLCREFRQENSHIVFAPVDLLNIEGVQRSIDGVIARSGRIDIVCNLTGGFSMGESVHATSENTWKSMFDLNVQSLLNVSQALVPHMIANGRGCIVNVGAYSALKGMSQMGAYTAAKSAVVRITESMSAELRDRNINVNCVLPSIIDTPANRAAMPEADPHRWVSPGDLAAVILFLCSDAARAVHGAALPVTGLS